MSSPDITAVIAVTDRETRELVCRCAERIPEVRVTAQARDGRDAIDLLLKHTPDVAVLDVLMPLYTGKEVLLEIRKHNLETRVLLMTTHDHPEYLAPAFWNDAHGYLYIGDGIEDWIGPALKTVIQGRHFASPTPLAALRNHYASFSRQPPSLPLTAVEVQILKLTVQGKSDKEMAAALDMPVRTVEKRKARLRRRIGVGSTVELAVFAVTQRLLDC
jgi:DNA-binding NarL/FixJ family response regulator